MRHTVGEVGTNSFVTYSCGPLHMNEQRQNDQLEATHNSSVPIHGVTLKTYLKRRMIEKGDVRGLGIYVLEAWHDDADDDDILYTFVNIWILSWLKRPAK